MSNETINEIGMVRPMTSWSGAYRHVTYGEKEPFLNFSSLVKSRDVDRIKMAKEALECANSLLKACAIDMKPYIIENLRIELMRLEMPDCVEDTDGVHMGEFKSGEIEEHPTKINDTTQRGGDSESRLANDLNPKIKINECSVIMDKQRCELPRCQSRYETLV